MRMNRACVLLPPCSTLVARSPLTPQRSPCSGRTPLHVAIQCDNPTIAEYLSSVGGKKLAGFSDAIHQQRDASAVQTTANHVLRATLRSLKTSMTSAFSSICFS